MNAFVLRRTLQIWFLFAAFLPFCLAHAADNNLQAIPELTSPVMDLTSTLSADQQQALSQKLIALHDKYGAQMQVLIIPTSAPEDAFTYSMRVVEQWKIGKAKKDDGLLLFIAKDDHRSQLQVGYGLEGVIPDVIAHRLLNDVMAPYFKQGDFYGGINAVIDGAYAKVSGDVSLASAGSSNIQQVNPNDSSLIQLVLLVVISAVIVKIMQSFIGAYLAGVIGVPLAILVAWLFIGIPFMLALVSAWFVLLFGLMPLEVWGAILTRGGSYGGGGGFGGGGWSGGGGGFGGGGAGGSW